jgi:hypothetical protein
LAAARADRPGRHVNAIAIQIVAIDDQVAEVQTDPEHDGSIVWLVPVGLGHGLLELNGSGRRTDVGC